MGSGTLEQVTVTSLCSAMNFKPIMATINPNLQEAAHDSTVSFLFIFFLHSSQLLDLGGSMTPLCDKNNKI